MKMSVFESIYARQKKTAILHRWKCGFSVFIFYSTNIFFYFFSIFVFTFDGYVLIENRVMFFSFVISNHGCVYNNEKCTLYFTVIITTVRRSSNRRNRKKPNCSGKPQKRTRIIMNLF